MGMTEDEADREAERLNFEVGNRNARRAHDPTFYVAVKREDGEWDVERRSDPPGRIERIIDRITDAI